MLELRRVDHNTFDLFQGKGWNNWTRVRKGRSSTFGVAGQRIPHGLMRELDGVLHKFFPINYGQDLAVTVHNLQALKEVAK